MYYGNTMRQCVAYIHDPYKTMTFDLKVKFVGCFPCLRVQPITSVNLALAIHFWYMHLSPWHNVWLTSMILIRHWSLTLMSIYRFLTWLCVQTTAFLFFQIDIYHTCTMFGTWVYHHGLGTSFVHIIANNCEHLLLIYTWIFFWL